jgi:hypothetical protein
MFASINENILVGLLFVILWVPIIILCIRYQFFPIGLLKGASSVIESLKSSGRVTKGNVIKILFFGATYFIVLLAVAVGLVFGFALIGQIIHSPIMALILLVLLLTSAAIFVYPMTILIFIDICLQLTQNYTSKNASQKEHYALEDKVTKST